MPCALGHLGIIFFYVFCYPRCFAKAERFHDAEGTNRKKLVANQRRYEGVYNRIADVCVTFCEKGGAAA